jgi:clan AA aspartic protease (TIGR02281 family)
MSVYLNMKKVLLGLFLFFIVNSNLFSQTVIKMKRDEGISIIPCKVNGLNLNFIFDTGASDVSLSMTEADFMLKNGYLSVSDIIGSNKFSDANGNISEGVVINLKEIEIAGLKLYNVKASIVKNNKAPLLLGQTAIGKLGKIQLDLEQNTLTILSGKGSYDFSANNQKSQESINPKPNQTNHPVIGKSIIIGNLEIAENDFPKLLDWDNAKNACASLGEGWRLPTKEELNILFENKEKIGGFVHDLYWSSTKDLSVTEYTAVWMQYFRDGPNSGIQLRWIDIGTNHVRAVRSL